MYNRFRLRFRWAWKVGRNLKQRWVYFIQEMQNFVEMVSFSWCNSTLHQLSKDRKIYCRSTGLSTWHFLTGRLLLKWNLSQNKQFYSRTALFVTWRRRWRMVKEIKKRGMLDRQINSQTSFFMLNCNWTIWSDYLSQCCIK